MEAVRFTDQYEMAAGVYGTSAAALRERDEGKDQPLPRWLAVQGDEAVAAVDAWRRPDGRTFLYFVGERAAYPLLSDAAFDASGRAVHAEVDASDAASVDALRAAGFEVELVDERFRIRFGAALSWLSRAWTPPGIAIHPADSVDEERLFLLDNQVRQDVPGTDGWQGDRAWFHDELSTAPPFDPAAYLVGVDERTGRYVGLVRIWRNPTGPRLGLVGVVPEYRNTTIAAALLKAGLQGAAMWGHDTFTAETSPVNTAIYKRMSRIGAVSLGQAYQMIRNAPRVPTPSPGSAVGDARARK